MAGVVVTLPNSSIGGIENVAAVGDLPAVGTFGEIYLVTDTGELYWWDGAAWSPVNSAVGTVDINADTTGTLRANRGGTGSANTFVGGFLPVTAAGANGGTITEGSVLETDVEEAFNDITVLQEQVLRALSTGVITGGNVTINADPTKVDISAGTGQFLDATNPLAPVYTEITWTAFTGVTVTNIGSVTVSYIGIDDTGTLIQQTSAPTAEDRRNYIWFAAMAHFDLATVTAIVNSPNVIMSDGNQVRDLMDALGAFNISGNEVSPNGADLTIAKTAGKIFRAGANFFANPLEPNAVTSASAAPVSFVHITQTGPVGALTTTISPGNYDVAGTVTAIPGSSNQATNMRVYLFANGGLAIAYGQVLYSNLANAIAGLATEDFTLWPNAVGTAVLLCTISVTKGATALNDPSTAYFINANKFGSGGSGVSSATTLQSAYNNGSTGQIQINATNGAFEIRDAATPTGGDLVHITDSAGTANYLTVTDDLMSTALPFRAANMTTTQRDALTPQLGMIIYNTTTQLFEGYFTPQPSGVPAWGALHGWGF